MHENGASEVRLSRKSGSGILRLRSITRDPGAGCCRAREDRLSGKDLFEGLGLAVLGGVVCFASTTGVLDAGDTGDGVWF
jgi:hypothetical protein